MQCTAIKMQPGFPVSQSPSQPESLGSRLCLLFLKVQLCKPLKENLLTGNCYDSLQIQYQAITVLQRAIQIIVQAPQIHIIQINIYKKI